jgi:transposase
MVSPFFKKVIKIMQNKAMFYLGMDVSKLWLDLAVLSVINHEKQAMVTNRFDNNISGMKKLDSWLKKLQVSFDIDSLLVIENTGIYHRIIWRYCSENNLPIYIGNAAHIKWSFGIARGKSDLIDCKRLCDYASKHGNELKTTPSLDPAILNLKDLMTTRATLVEQKTILTKQLKEGKPFKSMEAYLFMLKALQPTLDGLKTSIASVEAAIKGITDSDTIKTNHDLLMSVPGIGNVTATYLICCTSNFAGKHSGKQVACYAGVVPFGHSSGSSIKGKDRVHKMANKKLKKLLHLGALSAIKNYPEFRDYYERKKTEGKHPLSILNAIRNKLILRAVAVINNQQPYLDNYQKAA